MATNKVSSGFTNAQLLDVVVGMPLPQAKQQLEAMGYSVKVSQAEQKQMFADTSSTELVIGCSVTGNQVTLILSTFVLTPSGKLTKPQNQTK